MMTEYRKLEPLAGVKAGNDPGPAPDIVHLMPSQLVVNDEYQRSLSQSSIRMIKRMASGWDWSSFKAPSVAATDDPDKFEVVDGQHTVIAAATNRNVFIIPCMLMPAETLAAKANGFLGINQNRLALTPGAIFNAKVAAQDDAAIAVECALSAAGCRMVYVLPSDQSFKVGDTMAVATLMKLATAKGQDRLTMLLKLLREANATPVSSMSLKALDIALPPNVDAVTLKRVGVMMKGQGVYRLEMIAKGRTAAGKRSYEMLADMIADMAKLPEKRMGIVRKERAPRPKSQAVAARTLATAHTLAASITRKPTISAGVGTAGCWSWSLSRSRRGKASRGAAPATVAGRLSPGRKTSASGPRRPAGARDTTTRGSVEAGLHG